MDSFDVAVVGGGVLGCFLARNLTRYKLSIAVIEKNTDVCTEITRANTAIIYSGYDNKPGSIKAKMCVDANRDFDRLCSELGVPFLRCGSLMSALGPRGEDVLRKKYEQGLLNGVPGLKLLSRAEALAIEPSLNPKITMALYSPTVGTVNPWELGIAAIENAVDNGARLFLNTEVTGITPTAGGYLIYTKSKSHTSAGKGYANNLENIDLPHPAEGFVTYCDSGEISARAIVNCAGLFADKVSEMIAPPYFRIAPTRGDYIMLDTKAGGMMRHINFLEPEDGGKGATIVPTVDGNIMLGPSEEPLDDLPEEPFTPGNRPAFPTTDSGLEFVRRMSKELVPGIPLEYTIRSFAALRPNPKLVEYDASGEVILSERSINDFFIGSPEGHPLLINLAGIKTPGLTCANEIGIHVTDMLLERLQEHFGECHREIEENAEYNPIRLAKSRFSRLKSEEQKVLTGSQRIICRCRQVTEEEVRNAIRRTAGATTVDGVKRRAGTCMGRCQGSYCTQNVIEILAEELGIGVSDIRKDSAGAYMLTSSLTGNPMSENDDLLCADKTSSSVCGDPSYTGKNPSSVNGDQP